MTQQEKSQGFLGRLKGFVIEETPEELEKSAVSTKPVNLFGTPAPVAHTTTAKPGFSAPVPAISETDPQIRALLETDINEAAKPAYTRFAAVEQSLAPVLSDERTRFQAAMATIASEGHTVDKVLFDVDECLQALDKKERENEVAAKEAMDRKVGGARKQVDTLKQEIAEMQAKIAAKESEISGLNQTITETENSIRETEGKFKTTCAAYRQQLVDRKAKISQLGR